jgi:hypothetical protein
MSDGEEASTDAPPRDKSSDGDEDPPQERDPEQSAILRALHDIGLCLESVDERLPASGSTPTSAARRKPVR